MEVAGWVAVIGSIGTVLLQLLHMYLSYLRDIASYERDAAIKADTTAVAKVTNGLTEKIVAAELVAERVVAKAEVAATTIVVSAAAAAAEIKKT